MSDPPTAPAKPGDITIDRLTLALPDVEPAAGARLAQSVATHLARAGLTTSDVEIPRLSIVLDAPDIDLERLAQRIADAILRQVR
jgi:hypothetical protein